MTRPAGKCPFNHGEAKALDAATGQKPAQHDEANGHANAAEPSQTSASRAKCPFPHATSEDSSQAPADPATCPMGYGPQPSSADTPQTAQCPMGFSSVDGPVMTQFHCVICKSLLYDCVQLSCSCKYCRYCTLEYSDCPLCGADIKSRTPVAELQGGASITPLSTSCKWQS